MDTTEKEQLAQEQMDELKAALKKSNTVTNPGAVSGTDTITLGSFGSYNNTVIGGGYSVSLSGLNYPNTSTVNTGPYTISNGTSGINWGANITASPWATSTNTGKLNLEGDEADIVINGVSLLDLLRDRLNIMIPNPKLEKEWEELKELGDRYRELEAKLKEQGEMWAKLKSMPPPDPLY